MLDSVASVIRIVGKSGLFLAALFSFLFSYSMNSLLAQVRSLSLITHLMMMQLEYPAPVAIFYAGIFEFVTFDLVPTEGLYDAVFSFRETEPFSEEADNIGYSTRYAIENSGSITLFIFLTALMQCLYSLIICTTQKTSKVY